MNLLLLLSALLSAIGGVGGTRASQAPVALSSTVNNVEKIVVASRTAVAHQPAQVIAGPARAVMALPATWTIAPAVPVYLDRPRE